MRRVLIQVCSIALPTIGLAIGWMAAVDREREAAARERRGTIERTADEVVAAVGRSLESLRRAEDERPYDQYNYYWAPPDVLAAQEAVAVSPLAGPPSDARILGWFQVDPGGTARSPSQHPEAPRSVQEHGARVVAALGPSALAVCRALAHARAGPIEQAVARAPRRALPPHPVQVQNEWVSQVATEIQNANAGSAADLETLQQRGRAQRLARSERSWADVQAENVGRLDLSINDRPGALASQRPATIPQAQVVVPVSRRPAPHPAARTEASRTAAAPVDAGAGEVVYTPMAWGLLGDRLALYRVVTSEGASSVQGLLLDREALLGRWLPALAAEHAGAVGRARVIAPGTQHAAGCAVRRALGPPLDGVAICLEPRATAAAGIAAMGLQLAALAGLVLLMGAGAVALILAERRAARLAAMQREFVASVSHELRTPLTTLRMHAELLREGWVAEGDRPRFYDDLVIESTRLGQLVDNVLTLARLERGKGPDPTPGDLGAAVRRAVDDRRRFVELRGFTLELDAPACEARFDREALDMIVGNLLDNAVKYGAGEVCSVRVRVEPRGDGLFLTVSDRGPGIPERERARVFEAFYRARAGGSGPAGTGLGLAIVRRLAREQGGEAAVVPTTVGCTVEVRLRSAR